MLPSYSVSRLVQYSFFIGSLAFSFVNDKICLIPSNANYTQLLFNITTHRGVMVNKFDWFGWVLWHTNHCRLSNVKYC